MTPWMWVALGCGSVVPSALRTVPADQTQQVAALRTWTEDLADPALDGRDEGSEGSAVARRMLEAQLVACGVVPAGEDGFAQRIQTGEGTNLIGRVPGSDPTRQSILVSAHYDHQETGWWAHPGAMDNAAAVAAVLQVACGLARNPVANDIVIALWDAEEPPTFLTPAMGSHYWHAHPTIPIDRIGAAVVLDLVGGGLWDDLQTTFVLGSETSPQLRRAVLDTPALDPHAVQPVSLMVVEDLVIGRHAVWSDYDVFRNHEIPVLFVTDGQNKRYHTSKDRVEALDFGKLEAEAAWLARIVRRISAGPDIHWSSVWEPEEDRVAVSALLRHALADPATEAWGDLAREQLRASLDAVQADDQRWTDAARGAQRLMCWAGPYASRFTCGMM